MTLSSAFQSRAQRREEVLQGALAQAGLSRVLWGQPPVLCHGRMAPGCPLGLWHSAIHPALFLFSLQTTTACTLIKSSSAETLLGPWSIPLEGHNVPTPRVSLHRALRELGSMDHPLWLQPPLAGASPPFLARCTEFLQKLSDAFYEELFQGTKPVQNMMFFTGLF